MLGALTMQGSSPVRCCSRTTRSGLHPVRRHAVLLRGLLIVGLSSLRLMGKVLEMPRAILTRSSWRSASSAPTPSTTACSTWHHAGVGVVGFFMQRWDYPASPVVLA
ncbi:hypothetical protein [Azospirillum sp. TSH58]|uniref:hypothetical protein n=1 Tax=Azospirillum sp. TSH58 TaxID=664962 RepID=UPI0013A54178|nr:hypothetical protein [Azospirillum sp. TSH58]